MENNIREAVNIAIEENLPKQVGDVLQKRLTLADTLEAENDKLKLEIQNMSKTNIKQVKELTILRKTDSEAKAIIEEKKNLDLEVLKFDATKTIQEEKVTNANEKVDLLNNLVGLLMKNPQAVTMMARNYTYQHHGTRPDGTYGAVGVPDYSDTTITKTNEKPES